MDVNSDKMYWYHVEDQQFSHDFEDKKLLGNEGDTIKVWGESGDEEEIYILYIEDHYVECIGNVEDSFPKNWNEHMEWRKQAQELHKDPADIEEP